ncbi:HPr family phosphocarrier protein [Taylorella equigenitalis]|uniref:Phosphocarrier protein, nitrogen regulation associated n=2 Tax=Taylorella equigenitalis TaxID=29575 RepID=A0A654KGQ3_TAYEM|nr:HPr family phosphocarrier protein [Taylorella equigenitalis]ADU91056.1 Phosphocarrier protein, nitrogen regulation associated [Taylorella equigenitalis MCE9]AFN36159.1 phosphocarrier protein HPr [Taylorella equigenitalis ATCC 35865]ASY38091.1 HPr family phosphocarrier protein [Taylorella equigenitalis]ASY39566.1 phosphocarrier protein HPr [Taylorella equigenitalis]ASY41069.1 phosphocarrier protein HPr [Taylorella equigenitalis]
MTQVEVVISNKLGLHARAASKLTQLASKFKSEISISKGNQKVNAKSIMGVMLLAAGKGSTIIVDANGDDSEEALVSIKELFDSKFGEVE